MKKAIKNKKDAEIILLRREVTKLKRLLEETRIQLEVTREAFQDYLEGHLKLPENNVSLSEKSDKLRKVLSTQ